MIAACIGITLGLFCGYVSFRFEEVLFGATGFIGVIGFFVEGIAEPLLLSKAGVAREGLWEFLALVVGMIPAEIQNAFLLFFMVTFLTRLATWAYVHATFEPEPGAAPECAQTRRARVLSEYGMTEYCVQRLRRETEAYHRRWGG